MISLPVIIALVFLVTLGLGASAMYFLVATPLARGRLKMRLTTPQATLAVAADADDSREIVRPKTLSDIPGLNSVAPKIEFYLQQGAVKVPVGTFLLIIVGAALIAFLLTLVLGLSWIAVALLTLAAGFAPIGIVSVKRKRRFHAFEEQFADAIDMLARAVRAGHAFNVAFSLIADEMSDPIAEEFRITHRQQNLGMPIRDALKNLVVRMPLPDVRIFVAALQIQRESGGNLGEILDNLSTVIRDRFRLLREVEVLTSEARFSMYVLMAVPFGAALAMYFTNPEYIGPLFTDPRGRQMLMLGGAMQLVGYLIARKIVRIKV